MVDTQTILQFIPAVSLSIAAIYYMLILRNQNRTRQAQLFMQLFQHNMTKEWMKDWWELMQMQWDDIEDFYEKYDSSVNIDNFAMRFSARSLEGQVLNLLGQDSTQLRARTPARDTMNTFTLNDIYTY